MYPDGKLVVLEAHDHFNVSPTEKLIRAVENILGEDAVWLKVDNERLNTWESPRRRFAAA